MEYYSSIKYRKDIDGLRALAIIAVILYHAFPEYIRGGFVGVDIFFVISGYLISSILFKNFDINNFCIRTFYVRRIKRIFPALTLVLSFCLIIGWFCLTDIEYTRLASHAKASTLFYTNFVLAKESGYFDVSAHLKPLMHLWSLALEEQFYIFSPLVLYFATKKHFNIVSVCIVFIISSFIISIKTLHTYPVQAFYYPLPRVWELTAGVLLAYFTHTKFTIPNKAAQMINYGLNLVIYRSSLFYRVNILPELLSIVGLIINLLAIVFLKKLMLFRDIMQYYRY